MRHARNDRGDDEGPRNGGGDGRRHEERGRVDEPRRDDGRRRDGDLGRRRERRPQERTGSRGHGGGSPGFSEAYPWGAAPERDLTQSDWHGGWGAREVEREANYERNYGEERQGGGLQPHPGYGAREDLGVREWGRADETRGPWSPTRQVHEERRFGVEPYRPRPARPWLERKGPKGYKRSDARILEDVCDRLMQDDWIDVSDVEVKVAEGEVTLEGTVPERWFKRLAEDIAESVPGVMYVQNRIRHRRPGAAPQGA